MRRTTKAESSTPNDDKYGYQPLKPETTSETRTGPSGSHKHMNAAIARLDSDADPQDCNIVGCSQPAVFQTIKLRANGSEKQAFFCDDHGQEYAMRGHLVISQNV